MLLLLCWRRVYAMDGHFLAPLNIAEREEATPKTRQERRFGSTTDFLYSEARQIFNSRMWAQMELIHTMMDWNKISLNARMREINDGPTRVVTEQLTCAVYSPVGQF